jgi:hypothetical protein
MPTHYYSSAPAEPAEPAAPRKPSARTDSDSDGRLGPLRGRGALGGSSVPAVSQRRDAARALAPVSLACVAAVRGQGPSRCNNEMMRGRGRGHTVQASQDAEARPSPHLTSPRRSCKRRAGRAGQAGTSSRRPADTHSGAGLDERGSVPVRAVVVPWCCARNVQPGHTLTARRGRESSRRTQLLLQRRAQKGACGVRDGQAPDGGISWHGSWGKWGHGTQTCKKAARQLECQARGNNRRAASPKATWERVICWGTPEITTPQSRE